MRAGDLNRRIIIQRRQSTQDAGGQPTGTWVLLGKLWARPKNETGMAVIRGQREAGVPSNVARYSFEVRRDGCLALGVTLNDRISHDDRVFDIKAIIEDLNTRDRMYLVCEEGGSNG